MDSLANGVYGLMGRPKKVTEEEVTEQSTDKKAALLMAMSAVNKQFGDGSVMISGDKPLPGIDKVSTGSMSCDSALGGGIARGRVAEIWGQESTGKTTFCLQVIANAQKSGENCAFIDAEHALDLNYAKNLGVNTNELVVSQPNSGEEALETLDILIRSGALAVIVIDSVAALVPQAELEGGMDAQQMGLQAKLMSKAMRKITAATHETNTAVIFINQIRQKMVMFGNPNVLAGGLALKYYASQRMELSIIGKNTEDEQVMGNQVKMKVVKNKIAPPFREAEFIILFGTGIDKYTDTLIFAVKNNIVDKAGAWYSYNGERVGQGEANSVLYLKDNPSIYNEIESKCRKLFE